MNIDIKKLQHKQLEILKKLKKVCDQENIPFYLAYGTCLGAVRHNGFIPWDDDIDIIMKNSDFLKLLRNKELLPDNLFLQTADTDPEYGLPIARLRIDGTTLIEEDQVDNDIHHGVYIDIYPLYNCPKNPLNFSILKIQALIYRLFLYRSGTKNQGALIGLASKIIVKSTPEIIKKSYIKYFGKKISAIPESNNYITLYGNDFNVRYDKNYFAEPKVVLFENEQYPIPTDSDSYLKSMYGNYMELPPKKDQKHHHDFLFIDLENDYRMYKGIQYLQRSKSDY